MSNEPREKRLSIRISPTLLDSLKKDASKLGVSLSGYVRLILKLRDDINIFENLED